MTNQNWTLIRFGFTALLCLGTTGVKWVQPEAFAATPKPTHPSETPASKLYRPTSLYLAKEHPCAAAGTQRQINECNARAAQAADRRLNQVYQELRKTLSSQQWKRLQEAQLAWIRFRDRNCEFSTGRFEGGSIAPTVYSQCLERVTQQRTEELEAYMRGMQRDGIF